jgi:hypothetical protein
MNVAQSQAQSEVERYSIPCAQENSLIANLFRPRDTQPLRCAAWPPSRWSQGHLRRRSRWYSRSSNRLLRTRAGARGHVHQSLRAFPASQDHGGTSLGIRPLPVEGNPRREHGREHGKSQDLIAATCIETIGDASPNEQSRIPLCTQSSKSYCYTRFLVRE